MDELLEARDPDGNAQARRSTAERDALVLQWSGLPLFTVKRLGYHRRPDADDLVQEGHLGLIRAAELFDERQGIQFNTYAVNAILRRIWRAVKECGLIRVPSHISGQDRTRCQAALTPKSLQAATHHGNREGVFGDLLPDARATDPAEEVVGRIGRREDSDRVQALLLRLTPRERHIVRRHLLEGVPLCRVAGQLGIPDHKAPALLARATGKLRGAAIEAGLAPEDLHRPRGQ